MGRARLSNISPVISRSSSCVEASCAWRDHGRRAAVVRGARFLHVGDGDQADFVALFGLIELVVHRGQIALLRIEVILGGEHVEIALRDAGHQVLLRGLVVRFGLRNLRIRALAGPPSSASETNSA
jgi:hypothetical protein